MKEEKITIDIAPDGQLTADAEGFTGDACLRDLERLLADLASDVAATERKRDREPPRVAVARRQTVGRKP